ncbi:MAG: adenine deaminase [Dehalococcoidia bacterium]
MDRARLAAVAQGKLPADRLLRGAKILNVFTSQVEEGDVAIADGHIAGIGAGYEAAAAEDLRGLTLLPAFMDAHIHLESTLLAPAAFARVTVPHGTSAVVIDPHEIGNVLGPSGVLGLLEAGHDLPLDLLVGVPSCVPVLSRESAGAEIAEADVRALLQRPDVVGLAEVMSFGAVIDGDPSPLAKIAAAEAAGKAVDGHAPGLRGRRLDAYLAAGPASDHECTTLAEAREKLAKGMWIYIREASLARNLDALAPLLLEQGSRRCCLVSDDLTAETLCSEGHVDRLLRRAVDCGVPPADAVRAVTLNVADRFALRRRGAIAPGYRADVVAVEDLRQFAVTAVWKAGRPVARDGRILCPVPDRAIHGAWGTVRLGTLTPGSFGLPAAPTDVIEVAPGEILTHQGPPGPDALRLAVVERHRASGRVGLGWVRGFGPLNGAIGSTIAHDSHNLILAGSNADDLLTVARALAKAGGGLAVAAQGQIRSLLPLPIAGLMSDRSATEVLEGLKALHAAYHALGGTLDQPFVVLSFLALPVIPEIRVTDRGVVRVPA